MRLGAALFLSLCACADDVEQAKRYSAQWCAQFCCPDASEGGGAGGSGGGTAGGSAGGEGGGFIAREGDGGYALFADNVQTTMPTGACVAIAIGSRQPDAAAPAGFMQLTADLDGGDSSLFLGSTCGTARFESGTVLARGEPMRFQSKMPGFGVLRLTTDAGFAPFTQNFTSRGRIYATRRPSSNSSCSVFDLTAGTATLTPTAIPRMPLDADDITFTCTVFRAVMCGTSATQQLSLDGGSRATVSIIGNTNCSMQSTFLDPVSVFTGQVVDGGTTGEACLTGRDCYSHACASGACQCVMPGGSCREMTDCCGGGPCLSNECS